MAMLADCLAALVQRDVLGAPATALSRPLAAILRPWAALISLWWMYEPFTRNSCASQRNTTSLRHPQLQRRSPTPHPLVPNHACGCHAFQKVYTLPKLHATQAQLKVQPFLLQTQRLPTPSLPCAPAMKTSDCSQANQLHQQIATDLPPPEAM